MPPQIRKPAIRPTTSAAPTATSGAAPPVSKPVVRAPMPQLRFPPKPMPPGGGGGGSSTLNDPSYRPTGRIMPPDPMAGIPGGGQNSGAGAGAGAGVGGPPSGPFVTPIGAGGPQDIQAAISSLRGQLGMPAVSTAGGDGATLNYVSGSAGAGGAGAAGAAGGGAGGAIPPWKQLAQMGIGGQGSPQANRIRLAAALAERKRAGLGGGYAVDPVASAGGDGAGQDTMNRDPATADGGAPNPYVGLLRQRLGGRMPIAY